MINFKNHIVVKDTNHCKYGFIPLTHNQILELEDDISKYYDGKLKHGDFILKYGISPIDIILYGITNNVTSSLIEPYINVYGIQETERAHFTNSYPCFCGAKHGLDYTKTVLHRTPLSSWKCLLTSLNNPTHGLIFNILEYDKTQRAIRK